MSKSAGSRESLAIVLVTHYFPSKGGGVEIAAFELARQLITEAGARITWFASDTTEPPAIDGLECRPVGACNFVERRFGVPWPLWHPAGIAALWRAIGQADAVHLHDVLYLGNLIAANVAKLRGKPIVVTQHIGSVPYRSRAARVLLATVNRLIVAPVLRRAECVAFISQSVQSYFDHFCKWRRRPHFVPNGVDTNIFRPPSPQERAAARMVLGIREDARVLIFIGRFIENKGLVLLRELVGATPEANWLFVGSGRLDPDSWKLPNVRVVSGVRHSSVRDLLWAADLLVLPSISEGFPLVVQEATACGVPSLVSPESLEGYAPARSLLLTEALGPSAEERWLARLRAIIAGREPLPPTSTLVAFASAHWSWRRASSFYQRQFESLSALCAAEKSRG